MPFKKKPTRSKQEFNIRNRDYGIYTYKEDGEFFPLGNGSEDYLIVMDEFNKLLNNHLNDRDNTVVIISETKYQVINISLKEPYFYELIGHK
jgi:hypothetical protein